MSFGEERWEQSADDTAGSALPAFLLDPVGVAQRRWMPIAGCLALGLVATIAAVLLWKPIYQASATLLITSQKIPVDFVKSTVQEETLANINAMLGEVLTADSLGGVIDKLNLFPDKRERVARIDLVNSMRARISASPRSAQTGGYGQPQAIVYEIAYVAGDPNEAALVTNALAAQFRDVSAARRNKQAQSTTVFLREALQRAEAELREQSGLVTEFRQQHRGELPDEQQTSLHRLEILATQRASLSSQISRKEDRLLSIQSTGGEASETQVLLNELRRELARETAIHTDEHPNVVALQDRIARLGEAKTPAVSDRVLDEERREISRLREERARVEAELASMDRRVANIPIVAEQLTSLEQKEEVLRDDYTAALRKVEQAELAESLEAERQGGQVSILDEAVPPSSPAISRFLVLLIGLAASGILAVGVALLLELIDPVIIDAGHLKTLSDGILLGTVPHVNRSIAA